MDKPPEALGSRLTLAAWVGLLLARASLAEVTLDLRTGRLILDERGRIRALTLADGISGQVGISFWMRGDGHGGVFKFQLRDDKGATDYYIQNDFTGWRYQQLARPTPDPIDYRRVGHLGLYYNGLPGKTTVSCGIDGVKALPALDNHVILDPWVELAGQRWAWRGALEEGQYLTFWPAEPIRRNGLPLSVPEVSSAKAGNITLEAGKYPATFGCAGELTMPVRVRMTLQPPERHVVR